MEIEDYIRKASELDPWLVKHPPKVEWLLHWPHGEIAADHPICNTTGRVHQQVVGSPSQNRGYASSDGCCFSGRGKYSLIYVRTGGCYAGSRNRRIRTS
jgi:hypothetical protein